jgi:hypothetical protein
VNLKISEEEDITGSRKPGGLQAAASKMFVPRKTVAPRPRPRAGLGTKKTGLRSGGGDPSNVGDQDAPSSSQRGQDDFRKMLGGK